MEIRLEVSVEIKRERTKEHFLKKYCFTIIDTEIHNKPPVLFSGTLRRITLKKRTHIHVHKRVSIQAK